MARFTGLSAWTMIAAGLFVLGTADGPGRFWVASLGVTAGIVVLVLRALQVDVRLVSMVVLTLAGIASLGGFATVGFLSGPAVALTTTVMLTGLLLGRRALVWVFVVSVVATAAIAFAMIQGFITAPPVTDLMPTRAAVWLRTMSVTFIALALLSTALTQILEDMNSSMEQTETETLRRERAERVRADIERRAMETRHLETIGRLASGVAHDFNNNLTAIIGMAELMRAELPKESLHRQLVDQILQASLRSADLTRQLLAYSRRARVQPTATRLEELVHNSVSLVRRSMNANVEIVLDLCAPDATVSADPALLQSAIMNLLLNARDAIAKGGRITIGTRLESPTAVSRRSGKQFDKGSVLLTIADTGHGMSRDVLSRAFDPFFTTKAPGEGTGLGLSVVSGTIESHGGHIDVESLEGAGTTFHIRLPLIEPADDAASSEPTLARGNAEILVVDDEPTVRHAAGALLKSLGHRVTLAEDGDHAIRMVQSASKPFELVVLDSKMPGLGREETFRAIRDALPGVPVLFWSGRASDETLEKLLLEARTDFIQKPYRASELAKRVAVLTDEPGVAAPKA